MKILIALGSVITFLMINLQAEEKKEELKDFFISLKKEKTHMHAGPGNHFPIIWSYVQKNIPLWVKEVRREDGIWYKACDQDQSCGWVLSIMVGKNKTYIVTQETTELKEKPRTNSKTLALLKKSFAGSIKSCENNWCEVKAGDLQGWVQAGAIFGGVSPKRIVQEGYASKK